jgi:uncharacterized DUF497 family protein
MEFEWDEAKRLSNIAKHGFDFIDAEELLTGEHQLADRIVRGEQRRIAFGKIHGELAAVVFTMRGETYRIISIRRSRHDE